MKMLNYFAALLTCLVLPFQSAWAQRSFEFPQALPSVGPTGSAMIQIPLWEIGLRNYSIPLSITYNTSGLRVNDLHSIAGMGWSLNGGGFIHRQVREFPDEYSGEYSTDYVGWFDISQDEWFCDLDSIKRFYEGEWDFSPDFFSYSTSREAGSFIFANDKSIHPTNFTDLNFNVDFEHYDTLFSDVEFSVTQSQDAYFGSLNFAITDNHGTKSYFRPVEFSYTMTSQHSPFDLIDSLVYLPSPSDFYYHHFISDGGSITGWGLDRVETALGEVINYHYSDKVGVTEFEYPIANILTNTNFGLCDSALIFDSIKGWIIDTVTYEINNPQYWTTNSFEGKYVIYPDSITTENETVVFTYESFYNQSFFNPTYDYEINSLKIDDITVIDKYSRDTVSIIKFFFGYYPGNDGSRLDSLKSFGNSRTNFPSTLKFGYIDGDIAYAGSFCQDLFGYQNANTIEHMLPLVPTVSGPLDLDYLDGFDYTAADRSVNDSLCMAGSLNRLTYSAGANINLYYEVNSEQVGGTYPTKKLAPGLRISSIELRDKDESLLKKNTYTYSELSGQFFYENSYKYFFRESSDQLVSGGPTPYYNFTRYSSTPYLKYMGNPPHAGFYYGTIYETMLSGNNSESGTLIHKYSGAKQLVSFEPRLDCRILLGQNNTDTIKIESYEYEVDDYEINIIKRLDSYVFEGPYYECGTTTPIVSNPCCPTTSLFTFYSMTSEPLFFSPSRISKEINVSYNKILGSNDPVLRRVEKSIDYSDQINLPAKISTTQFLSDLVTPFSIIESNIRYSGDYSETTTNQMVLALQENSIKSAIIDTWITHDEFLTEVWSNEYNTVGQLIQKNRFILDIESISATPWDEEDGLTISETDIYKELEIEYVDKNPTLRITPEGTELTIWGYNNSLPVAFASKVSPNQVFYTSFEEDTLAVLNSMNSKTGTHYFVLVQAFEINQVLPAGEYIMTYFHRNSLQEEWEYVVESKSLSTDGTVSTSITSGQIDELRVFPTGKPFRTYTYKPFFGVTSETDINGRTTFFNYDGFGRQILVRDQFGNILRKMLLYTGR